MVFVYKIMKVYVFDPNKVLETLMKILRNKIVERVFGSVNDHAMGVSEQRFVLYSLVYFL